MSALCAGFSACNGPNETDEGIQPLSRVNCVVYVNTTSGEESILLARSVFAKETDEEYSSLFADFPEYEQSLKIELHAPVEEHYHNAHKVPLTGEKPNCYELTMTLKVPIEF